MSKDRHDHQGHSHAHGSKNEGRLAIAAGLTGAFMLAEVAGGLIAGSLALLADAGHMLTDFASLMLAWFALRLAARPATWNLTYGFDRFSVLAAFVNGLALFAIAIWIVVEAVHRLSDPRDVLGGLMLWVALAGLVVNIVAFRVLTHGETENLNVRAAALHVMGDLLGSIGAIAASAVILLTGWTPIDPILSVLVSVIILRSAWAIVRESGHILLEGAPRNIDTRNVATTLMEQVPGIGSVDHVHAWSVTQERPMITLEIRMNAGQDAELAKRHVKQLLQERFGIAHSTVEIV